MRRWAVVLVALCCCLAAADNYMVQTTNVGTTLVFYPACQDNNSDDTCDAALGSNETFPGIVIGHGGAVANTYYSSLATQLAARGYIVSVPQGPFNFLFGFALPKPQTLQIGKSQLVALSNDLSSVIAGRLQSDNVHVMGHSFGGVMAVLAASSDGASFCNVGLLALVCGGYTGTGNDFKSAVVYGTTMYTGPTLLNTNTTIPVVLVRGENDVRVSNASVYNTYALGLEAPKAYVSIADQAPILVHCYDRQDRGRCV
jgi:dienelactone hydrolase